MKMIKYDEESKEVIYEQVKHEFGTPVKVKTINITTDLIGKQVPKHWHRSLEIIVPKKHSTQTWIEGVIYDTPPGDFIVVNSKEIHSCRNTHSNEDYFGYCLQIKYDFLKDCFSNIDSYYFETLCLKDKQTLLNIIDKIIEMSLSDDSLKNVRIYGYTYELIYLLLKNHCFLKGESYSIQSEKQKNKLVSILSYIDENCDHIEHVDEIASYFNFSYGYIASLFKKHLNMTVMEYINYARIKKIEEDLIISDLTIEDLCAIHGFKNKKSFYREFKKYHHVSPKEYRESSRR